MTLYILCGGYDRTYEEFGPRLSRVIHLQQEHPRILDVFFASEDTIQDDKFSEWSDWYSQHFGGAAERRLALKEDFLTQVEWANVIYLHGGKTSLLVESLAPYPHLKEAFEGKIVIGSSAGANYLSSFNYSPSQDSTQPGSGMVPFAVIVHYGIETFDDKTYSNADWASIVARVNEGRGKAPLLLLPEGSFTLVEV